MIKREGNLHPAGFAPTYTDIYHGGKFGEFSYDNLGDKAWNIYLVFLFIHSNKTEELNKNINPIKIYSLLPVSADILAV